MNRAKLLLIVMFISTLAAACGGGGHMVKSASDIMVKPEMATIVFYRSTKFGGKIQSAIIDVTNPEPTFVGSLSPRRKVAVQVPAGDYTFMILGENADFAYASVEAGHTYYMAAMVRMGVWKARFSLNPVTKEELSDPSFAKLDVCELYEKTPASEEWFVKHKANIQKKREAYFAKWMAKDEADRPRLVATDHQ